MTSERVSTLFFLQSVEEFTTRVVFSPVSVGLLVCHHDYTKTTEHTFKLGRTMGRYPGILLQHCVFIQCVDLDEKHTHCPFNENWSLVLHIRLKEWRIRKSFCQTANPLRTFTRWLMSQFRHVRCQTGLSCCRLIGPLGVSSSHNRVFFLFDVFKLFNSVNIYVWPNFRDIMTPLSSTNNLDRKVYKQYLLATVCEFSS